MSAVILEQIFYNLNTLMQEGKNDNKRKGRYNCESDLATYVKHFI